MARTKEFSSAPPSKGSVRDPLTQETASVGMQPQPSRKTNSRFIDDLGTQIRVSATMSTQADQNTPPPGPGDPRNTLIMKPGQVAGGAMPQGGQPKPRKKYGLPAGIEQHTVIMNPAEAGVANAEIAAAAASAAESTRAASSHPSARNLQQPKIELVQHEIPTDAPYDPRLIILSSPDSERAAAFRILRHHVIGCGHPQVIAVSGPFDGCGKTTVAINLAMALAECGRAKVLLIDANLARPKVASIMRFVPPWCLSEQLDKHLDDPFAPWGLVEIANIGLHVAAMNPRNEQRKRLNAPAFVVAMERLRLGPYEHIVVDCPSVIGNADVNLIQDSTDGVLLAARTREVTSRDIRTAVDQLTPTKILGTALFES